MANFSIIADVMVRGLDSLKRLAATSEEVANETDEASDALDRFGKASGKAGKAADRASLDLEDAAQKFRAMGSSGTLAGDTLERFSIITSGPVGAAIGGLIVGTAAATAGFQALKLIVTEGIKTNEEYTKGIETLTGELNRTAGILGQVLLDVIDFGGAVETSNTKVKDFNDSIVKDSTEIADTMRDIFAIVLKGIKFIGNGFLGIGGIISAIGKTIGMVGAIVINAFTSIPDIAANMMLTVAKVIRAGLEKLGVSSTILDQVFGTEAQLAAKLKTARAGQLAAAEAQRAIWNGYTGDLDEIVTGITKFNDRLDNEIARLEASAGKAVRIKDPKTPRPPGTPKPPAAEPGEEMVFGVGEVEPVTTTPRLSTGETVEEFRARMSGYGAAIDDLKAKLGAINVEQEVFNTKLFEAGKLTTELAAQSFMQLGGSIAFAMGEMAAGASTLKDFGDTMADLAGQIAGSFGQLFVQMGAGFLLISPGIGAGLIAAGLGLQVLSGFLSGKGSGNRGGGGGRSSAGGAGRDIAREISRSLRPSGDDGPAVTNIEVVIGGRSIQPEMVSIIDDIARQRRSRYLGRRMGV